MAGGRSIRMGRDKAWLEWQGRPLWRVMVETLAAAGARRLVIACREEQRLATALEAWGRETGVRMEVRLDPVESEEGEPDGMLGALVRGVRGCGGSVLAVPVDMPMLEAGLLRRLWEREETARGCGVVLRDPEGEPVAFPVLISPAMARELDEGTVQWEGRPSWRRWLAYWLKTGAAVALNAGPGELAQLQNWNRPEDLPPG